jgi:hypothetical protein
VYFYSDDIVELHNEQIALNEVLRKGGFQTDSYASLRKLKDEALAAKDYHGAFIYLQRGLGDHHDEALRTELVKVRQSIKESDDHIAMADVKEAKDKLQALQALQTKCFGEGSYHLVSTDRKIAYLDALLGNSSTAVRLLEQRIAKLPDRP